MKHTFLPSSFFPLIEEDYRRKRSALLNDAEIAFHENRPAYAKAKKKLGENALDGKRKQALLGVDNWVFAAAQGKEIGNVSNPLAH